MKTHNLKVKVLAVMLSVSVGITLVSGCSQRVDVSTKDTTIKQQAVENVSFRPQMVVFQGSKDAVTEWFAAKGIAVQVADIDVQENLFSVSYESADSPQDISQALSDLSGVTFAEPNYTVTKQDLVPPKDTHWMLQWFMLNIGQDSPKGLQGKPGADIDVMEAWDKTHGSKEVVVGIIDTGIDYTHPELADNMWVNEAERGGMPGVDDDNNGYVDDVFGWNFITDTERHMHYGQLGKPDPKDDNSHGTHVAGVIGAKGNNFQGISGINWEVRLMALKFLDAGGSGSTDDAYRAIKYAVDNGAHILSNSWGGGGRSKMLEIAIKKAEDAGVLFVAAAGNSGENGDQSPHFPSSYENENVLSVAATDNRDRMATFSNYGVVSVDIAAPGVDIMSTIPVEDLPSKAYASYSGTSMATPMVSGAAALLMAHRPELRGNGVEVKRILMGSSDRIPMLEGKVGSGGRLNVFRALETNLNFSDAQEYEVVSEEVNISSPRYPQELVDHTWVFSREGAVQTRVYFESVDIDAPQFDLLALYNMNLQHILSFESPALRAYWTPWIEGSGVRVRFANAWVQMNVYEWRDYPSQGDAFSAGASDCYPSPNLPGGVTCKVSIGLEAYANYESEGFHISKVEYRVRKGE